MKVVCCACKKDLGEKPPLENKSISHGYCASCFQAAIAKLDELKRKEDNSGDTQEAVGLHK